MGEKEKTKTGRPEGQQIVNVGKEKAAAVAAATPKKSAAGWRIGAAVCWALSIASMVWAIIFILEGNDIFCYIGIAAAAVFCFAGGMLWKKANRVRPCTVKQDGSTGSKIKTFLWNQMGVVVTFIVFLPIGLFVLLKGDKLSKKGKTIALILTLVLMSATGLGVADYNAPVAESEIHADPNSVTAPAGLEAVDLSTSAYYTKYGYSFHVDGDCSAIRRSLTIYEGTIADAIEAGKLDPCDFCTTPETLPGMTTVK